MTHSYIKNLAVAAMMMLTSTAFYSLSAQENVFPPALEDIFVCEGGSTLIVPIDTANGTPCNTQPILLGQEDFDGNGIGYSTSFPEFNNGSSDHFGVTDGSNISNVSGAYSFESSGNQFFAAEDMNDGGASLPGLIKTNNVSISGYGNIELCFDIAAGNENGPGSSNYDALDFVSVRADIDGTINDTLLCFNYRDNGDNFNEPFDYDNNCDGSGDGMQILTTAQQYCVTLPSSMTDGASNLSFEIEFSMDSGSEEIAFDNLQILGTEICQTILGFEDFDGGGVGYFSTGEFNDGTSDHFGVTDGSNISNISGPYSFQDGTNLFFAAEDVNDAGGPGVSPASITLNPIFITGFTDIQFCFDIAAGNENGPGASAYDATDFVSVDVTVDNAGQSGLLCYNYRANGDDFNEPLDYDVDCDGIGDGMQLLTTAQQYCVNVPSILTDGNTFVQFSIVVAMDSGNEEIAFDNIVVSGTGGTSSSTVFNFYDEEPDFETILPIAEEVPNYDPMTTPMSSPDTFWVTTVDTTSNIESEASVVIVNVFANPNAEAGESILQCGIAPIALMAETPTSGTGIWSGGAGSFDDNTMAMTNYNPVMSELGTSTTLYWTVSTDSCGSSTDSLKILFIEEAPDPEFTYGMDTICPGDGQLIPMHSTGEDGVYTVTSGNPDSIDLDPQTGIVTIENTAEGTYSITNTTTPCGSMIITAIYDGPLTGGIPKGVELYVANDIPDLSSYGLGSANNGGGSDGIEFTFPAVSASKGEFIYVASEITGFETFFGFTPDYFSSGMLINGDDAIELFCDGLVIDQFGDINVDGTGTGWDHVDSWAYRNSGESINGSAFEVGQFYYGGPNALDGEVSNASAQTPVPIGTFTTSFMGVCPNRSETVEISIGDFIDPVFNCPPDMTISLDAGECATFASIMDIDVMDNCSPDIEFVYISGPMNGDYLTREDSPYTVVFEAMEDDGTLYTCSYNIFVEEFFSPSTTMACNGQSNISLDQDCQVTLTADMLLEGGLYGCYDDYIVEANIDGESVGVSIPTSAGTGNYLIFDDTYINQVIEVSIVDPETGNSCWGTIVIEDKLAPVLNCQNYTVDCDADLDEFMPEVTENCGEYYIDFDEDEIYGSCTDSFYLQIIREYQAVDEYGNQSEICEQVFTYLRESIDSIALPPHYDGLPGNEEMLPCDGADVVWNTNEEGLPSPYDHPTLDLYGTGFPGVDGCNSIDAAYVDAVIPTCGTSYKVIRTWTIIDWCTGEILEYQQIIKVMDQVGPEVEAIDDQFAYTDPWTCEIDYKLPTVTWTDNCNDAEVSFNVPAGFVYTIGDNFYWSLDNPILNQSYVVTAVVTDECNNSTEVPFNVTVIDNSPPVIVGESSLTVTLAEDGTAKIFAHSFDDGSYDACTEIGMSVARMSSTCDPMDKYPPIGDDNFQFNEIVHFCCQDAGQPQVVMFRVCDDAGQDGLFGNNDLDNCNQSMIEVIVLDKIIPVVDCPDDTTVSCIDVNGIDWDNDELVDNLFGAPSVAASCFYNLNRNVIQQFDCPNNGTNQYGFIIRQFLANSTGGGSQCQQVITIVGEPTAKMTCDRISLDMNNPLFDQITTSMQREFWFDDPTEPDPFPCFDSHWCEQNGNPEPNCPADEIPSFEIDCNEGFTPPEVILDIDALCTEAGVQIEIDTFNFAGGACKKFLVHYEVIDNCVFDENYVDPITGEIDPYNSDNGYFELYIEVNAFDKVGPELNCDPVEVVANSCTGIDSGYSMTASDNCSSEEFFGYQWRLDVGNDNTIDFPANGWYNGNEVSPEIVGIEEFPVGEHKVYWVVSDGCGNNSSCTQIVTVLPNQKQPTPYCHYGLTTTLMSNGMVELWASDFDAGSFDNCTPIDELIFSFSEDINDNSITFTCDDIGFQLLEIWVTDADGNQDFCTTTAIVTDNGNCTGTIMVSGSIDSKVNYIHDNSEVMVSNGIDEYMAAQSDDSGDYAFGLGTIDGNTMVYPHDNSDVLYGVTTLDIILIQKHILGLETFTDSERLIAADVNNDDKISGSDIVQIRKLILGINSNFKNNDSWNFYPGTLDITQVIDPFNTPGYIMLAESENYDFNSIKIGDVNFVANADGSGISTRNEKTIIEYSVNETQDGFVYTFKPTISDEMEGLQMVLDGVNSEVELRSGMLETSSSNYHLSNNQLFISLSEIANEGQDLFYLHTKEELDLELDGLNELYVNLEGSVKALDIELRKSSSLITSFDFVISPNPFKDVTSVTFENFIENERIPYEVFNSTGKLVFVGEFTQAESTIDLKEISESGVYYITCIRENQTITKKFIKL